jgi:hypothetical protein
MPTPGGPVARSEKRPDIPAPGDVKRGHTVNRMLNNIRRATNAQRYRNAPRSGEKADGPTVFHSIGQLARHAVRPATHVPPCATVVHYRAAGDGVGENVFRCKCFGCDGELRTDKAGVVVRMGGLDLCWHQSCFEASSSGSGSSSSK